MRERLTPERVRLLSVPRGYRRIHPNPSRAPYRLAPLTPDEYAALESLSVQGSDGGLLKLAGVEKVLPNGHVVLGALTEADAWSLRETIEDDPASFLPDNARALPLLSEKMWGLLDSII